MFSDLEFRYNDIFTFYSIRIASSYTERKSVTNPEFWLTTAMVKSFFIIDQSTSLECSEEGPYSPDRH